MIGDIFKKLRLEKGLSMKNVAKILDLKEDTYSTYERGTRKAPIDVIIKLADYYEVTTDYLLGRDDRKFVENVTELTDNELDKKLIQFFAELPEQSKQGIRDFMLSVVDGLSDNSDSKKTIQEYTLGELEDFQLEEKSINSDAG